MLERVAENSRQSELRICAHITVPRHAAKNIQLIYENNTIVPITYWYFLSLSSNSSMEAGGFSSSLAPAGVTSLGCDVAVEIAAEA